MHAHLTLGEALKMLRELQRFTQADLAKITGISQSNISALESSDSIHHEYTRVILYSSHSKLPLVYLLDK